MMTSSYQNLVATGNARVHAGNNIYYSENRCLEALRVTDPAHDKARIEDDKGGLLTDVYKWVLSNEEFRRWRVDDQSRLLWIRGDPGKGKTMLLCGIINELGSELENDGSVVSYFFCQATDARINSATAVLRGLIYMLVAQKPLLLSQVQEKYDQAGRQLFEGVNAWIALRNIFLDIVRDPGIQPYLVVDALDECQTGRAQLLDLIISTSATTAETRAKWIVSSRNWPEIEEKLAQAAQIPLSLELNAESVSDAVKLYINGKVEWLAKRKSYNAGMMAQVASYLSSNATDTFLWVAIICQALERVHPSKTLKTLQSFPAGLNALYIRMMDQISNMEDSGDTDLCFQILGIVSAVYRPITLKELESLVDIPQDIQPVNGWLENYVKECGSFLAIRENTVYFVHQSAKDFLCNDLRNSEFNQVFPRAAGGMHYMLFSRSLQFLSRTLRRNMYRLPHPGVLVQDVVPPNPDPLASARYSCVYWVDHLFDACANNELACLDDLREGGTVDNFICKGYLFWLEASSLVGEMSKGVLTIEKLHSLLQSKTQESQLHHVVRDMRRFILTHRVPIETAPLQAYVAALIFSPTRSLTRRLFESERPKWLSSISVEQKDWSACLATLEGHGRGIMSVAFSGDGRRIASASSDGIIKLWDTATGACEATLEGHSTSVLSVVFSPENQYIVSASTDCTIRLWSTATGTCITTFIGHSGSVDLVAFLPDGRYVMSASQDGTIRRWDTATGTCAATFTCHRGGQYDQYAGFSPDRQYIAAPAGKNITIWDIAAPGIGNITFEGHDFSVRCVTYSPDGRYIASASSDHTVKVWNIETAMCEVTLKGHNGGALSVAFSPDGHRIVSASHDRTVKLWDIGTGVCIATFEGHQNYITSVTFSSHGLLIASASYDNTVKLWDAALTTGTQLSALDSSNGTVESVTFSHNGQCVASGSLDGKVMLWSIATATCFTVFHGHGGAVRSVNFSPGDGHIVSTSDDCTIRLWDAINITCEVTFAGHSASVLCAAFSTNGQHIASGSEDRTVKLWDRATGVCIRTFFGHTRPVGSVAFSPDSRRIASVSWDNTVMLWETARDTRLQIIDLSLRHDFQSNIIFDATSTYLDTENGPIDLGLPPSSFSSSTSPHWFQDISVPVHGFDVSDDGMWVTNQGNKFLWLPSEYRPSCFAVKGSIVAIGCPTGRVWFLSFSAASISSILETPP